MVKTQAKVLGTVLSNTNSLSSEISKLKGFDDSIVESLKKALIPNSLVSYNTQ